MCGRFAQYRMPWEYLEPIGLQLPLISGVDSEPINQYNVAPRSRVRILHQDPDGLRWDLVPWGWEPFWAKGKRPPTINARSETVAAGKFFKPIWKTGRCYTLVYILGCLMNSSRFMLSLLSNPI